MAIKARILLALSAVGCSASFQSPAALPGEEHSVWNSHYVFGAVGGREVDVRELCPDGRVSQVETGANLGTLALSVLTIGIYTPRVVTVTCTAKGPR